MLGVITQIDYINPSKLFCPEVGRFNYFNMVKCTKTVVLTIIKYLLLINDSKPKIILVIV